jgi:uncharacterized membrane protein YfcA
MAFRNYLVGTIFAVLLIWGPIDHTWPAWLAIRIGYLILIPLVVGLLLGWVWNHWPPSEKLEDILKRILSSVVAVALLLIAIYYATSDSHLDNTQWIRTRDGMEAVGDDVVVPGPDWGMAFIFFFLASLIFWYMVVKKNSKRSNN